MWQKDIKLKETQPLMAVTVTGLGNWMCEETGKGRSSNNWVNADAVQQKRHFYRQGRVLV